MLIKERLCSRETTRRRVVIFSGPAGIGKSYLANKTVYGLRKQFTKQEWLCCTREIDLNQDIFSALQQNSRKPCSKRSKLYKIKMDSQACFSSKLDKFVGFDQWLFVLDDVCSVTLPTISQLLMASEGAFVITTRNSAVVEFLGNVLSSPLVLTLEEFSDENARELLKAKAGENMTEIDIERSTRKAQHVFSSLPLCVSIYSSLQAARSTMKNTEICRSSSEEVVSFQSWKKVEGEFGDRFHVRGLSGILELARKEVEDKPLVLFFLAKLTVCLSETIPWQVLVCSEHSDYSLRKVIWIEEDCRWLFRESICLNSFNFYLFIYCIYFFLVFFFV